MRSLQVKRGFTLIELLVVIAIIAILASILFPVFAKAREKARQTTCMSQVRQMATASQMYNQDNNGRFPSYTWADAILGYLGNSNKMLFCPSDAANDATDSPISYGYSGLMVRADGTGVNEASIKAPTEVGVFCDASPTKSYPNGGLVGGGALQQDANIAVVPAARHSGGTVVGYADGHAKYIPKGYNEKDLSNGVTRAFIEAAALGLIDNPAGGIGAITGVTFPTTSANLTIGGDFCVSPIINAACEVWKKNTGASAYTKGFMGLGYTLGRSNDYLWGDASNVGLPIVAPNYLVARDCMVFITAKNTKIPVVATANTLGGINAMANGVNSATTAQIAYLFGTYHGYSANTFQGYTYDSNSSNYNYVLQSNVLGNNWTGITGNVAPELNFGSQCLTAANDQDMVDKVANDAYGIGYCSSAMADPDRVQILAIQFGAATPNNPPYYFPNANVKYRWTVPTTLGTSWPWIRNLVVHAAGLAAPAATPANNTISEMMFKSTPAPVPGFTALMAGPLFKCNYFPYNTP